MAAVAATLTDKDTIVLADFTNTTGDPVFDDTLRQGLAVQLQQSPFLSLVSDDRMRRTLALMEQRPDARLTPDVAQGVCVRTASAAVLEGSIAASAVTTSSDCARGTARTGDILADEQAQAARKEDVLGTLSQIATRFRTRVGESLATIEKHSVPLEEATTPSLEAWKAYSNALKAHYGHRAGACRAAVRAGDRDRPELRDSACAARAQLQRPRRAEKARQSILRAYQLRDRTSDVERFFIDTAVRSGRHRQSGTGAADAGVVGTDLSTRSVPHGLLSGLATGSTGKYRAVYRRRHQAYRARCRHRGRRTRGRPSVSSF